MILFLHNMKEEVIQQLSEELQTKITVKTDIGTISDEEFRETEIIVGFGPTLDRLKPKVLNRFSRLRWLHVMTAGVETLPFEVLEARKIVVTNSRGIHATQISEQILGMMISFTRGLHYNLRNQLKRRWAPDYPLTELSGKTLCIVGAGRIGKELARKAKAFDMKVIGVKKNKEALDPFDQIYDTGALSQALKQGDFVVVLIPLTPQTRHLIGEKEFRAMKPTAIFLNYARGDVVDEEALIRALQEGIIHGAGLDVFHREPLPEDHPFWTMENVLISPHNAGSVKGLTNRILQLFKENFRAYQSGLPLKNVVDLREKY